MAGELDGVVGHLDRVDRGNRGACKFCETLKKDERVRLANQVEAATLDGGADQFAVERGTDLAEGAVFRTSKLSSVADPMSNHTSESSSLHRGR